MTSSGPHTSTGQFFITMQTSEYLSGKFIGFGSVVKGGEVLEELNGLGVVNERPEGVFVESVVEITE